MVIICISAELFGGFQMDIDPSVFSNLNDITEYIKSELIIKLNEIGLIELVNKLKKTNFHFHITYDELLTICSHIEINKKNEIVYLCDHIHSNTEKIDL